jgi:hypothetical protein
MSDLVRSSIMTMTDRNVAGDVIKQVRGGDLCAI